MVMVPIPAAAVVCPAMVAAAVGMVGVTVVAMVAGAAVPLPETNWAGNALTRVGLVGTVMAGTGGPPSAPLGKPAVVNTLLVAKVVVTVGMVDPEH